MTSSEARRIVMRSGQWSNSRRSSKAICCRGRESEPGVCFVRALGQSHMSDRPISLARGTLPGRRGSLCRGLAKKPLIRTRASLDHESAIRSRGSTFTARPWMPAISQAGISFQKRPRETTGREHGCSQRGLSVTQMCWPIDQRTAPETQRVLEALLGATTEAITAGGELATTITPLSSRY